MEIAAPDARHAFDGAAARLTEAGIELADRRADPVIEEVEGAISDAAELTCAINAWEGRWPLNTYRDRDRSKLSRSALERLATAEAMTLADYGAAIARRQRNREIHARLAARYDATITLAAPGAALGDDTRRFDPCPREGATPCGPTTTGHLMFRSAPP